jgi:hypothetical protein
VLRRRALLICLATLGHRSVLAEGPQSHVEGAVRSWVERVDAGDATDSWRKASPLFQKRLPESAWVRILADLRRHAGKLLTRELVAIENSAAVEGMPPGVYAVVKFKAQFERLGSATETAIAVKENDGTWAIVGYFIR